MLNKWLKLRKVSLLLEDQTWSSVKNHSVKWPWMQKTPTSSAGCGVVIMSDAAVYHDHDPIDDSRP